MEQVFLRFTPAKQPTTKLYGSLWREECAKRVRQWRGECDSVRELFHHSSDGRVRSSKPTVCFLASDRWAGVLATGPTGQQLLRDNLLEVVQAANEFLGPCAMERHDVRLGYEDRDGRVYSYAVMKFVLGSGLREVTVPLVHETLVRNLNLYGEQFGIDLNLTSGDVLVEEAPSEPPAMFDPSGGAGRWGRARSRVMFSMPLKLNGYWFACGLASKGYGLVRFRRPSVPLELAA